MSQKMTTNPSPTDQRELLLNVATAEFAAHGYEATSVQKIASAADVSKAKVFYYFGGKEDLYAQVLDRTLNPLLAPLETAQTSESAEAFWTSLESGLIYASEFGRRDRFAAALVRDLYRRGADTPSLRRLLDRARTAISAWIRDGRRIGAVRTDLQVPVLAEAVVGAFVHVDRWVSENVGTDESSENLLSDLSLVALARDALQQRVPAKLEANVSYAAENVPRDTDAYLDTSAIETRTVVMRDGRQRANAPTFEQEGFELFTAPVVFTEPPDDREARASYAVIEAGLKSRLKADFVRIFDHTVRHTERTPGQRPPIRIVHADYGQNAGDRRLTELLAPDEINTWKGSHVVVANLWQSVAGIVHSTPLGFVDIQTVRDEDFVPVKVRYGDREGHIGYYRPNDIHQWYWFPFLRPEESVLFKTYDGEPGNRHWSCPHAAFTAPNAPEEFAGRRTSIEFRILLAFKSKA